MCNVLRYSNTVTFACLASTCAKGRSGPGLNPIFYFLNLNNYVKMMEKLHFGPKELSTVISCEIFVWTECSLYVSTCVYVA